MNDSNSLYNEQYVIGAALVNPDTVRASSEEVSPDDFLYPLHQEAWRSIVRRWSTRQPISEPLVARDVQEAGCRVPSAVTLFEMRERVGIAITHREAARLVHEEAVRRRLDTFASRIRQAAGSGMDLAELMTLARGEFDAVKRSGSKDMDSITLDELLSEVDEYDWVIPGLMEREDRLMITGAEGGGKTTLGRQVCIMAAAGLHPMTGQGIDPVRVQVIDCENTPRQWRRKVRSLTAKAKADGSTDPGASMEMSFPGRVELSSERYLGSIHRLLDRTKPDLLYIGPLYKLAMNSINSDDDAAPILAALDSIRERGIALVIEAHAGHSTTGDGGKRNLRPRGSSQLLGWPEMGFGLRVDEEDPSVSVVERWRGDRDEREWPEKLRRGGEWPWTPAASLESRISGLDWTDQS